jgi:hypothetical protein
VDYNNKLQTLKMLSAAAFAIHYAENAVPATAPADFQAGVLFGYSGKDLRTQVNACFAPDQKLADDTAGFIAAIEAKDFDQIKSIVAGDEKLAIADADTCMKDPQYAEVANAYNHQIDLVTKAVADPDWQIHAIKGLRPHISDIKANTQAALAAWDSGDYYGAGVKIGEIDSWVFTYWEQNQLFLQ